MFTGEAWTVQDEMEHMRQEQLRVKKLRDEAFTAGYELGAVWGMTNGVKELSRVFAETADFWENYPPELVRSFAESMVENIPAIEKVLLDNLDISKKKLFIPER